MAWTNAAAPRQVKCSRRADKDLTKLPKRDAARVKSAIERVSEGDWRGVGIIHASDSVSHRLRVGHWRATLEFGPNSVEVVRVLHRSEVDRKSGGFHQALPSDLGLPEHGIPQSFDQRLDAGDDSESDEQASE